MTSTIVKLYAKMYLFNKIKTDNELLEMAKDFGNMEDVKFWEDTVKESEKELIEIEEFFKK